jgi:hypothetical protein
LATVSGVVTFGRQRRIIADGSSGLSLGTLKLRKLGFLGSGQMGTTS